jgi:tellurite resistance protein TerC
MVWLNDWFGGKFPISWSLGIILGVIAVSVVTSLAFPKKEEEALNN